MTIKEVKDRIKAIQSAGDRRRKGMEMELYLDFIEYVLHTSDDNHVVDLADRLLKIRYKK